MTLKDVYYYSLLCRDGPFADGAQHISKCLPGPHRPKQGGVNFCILNAVTQARYCVLQEFFFKRCKMRCFGSASLFSKARRSEGFAPRPSLPIIDENDDDERVLINFFANFDKNQDKKLSRAEIVDGLNRISSLNESLADSSKKFLELLDTEVKNVEDKSITLNQFKEIAGKVPRIKGQRLQWVKSFNLNGRLAALLSSGDLFDQLSGIRSMEESELTMALRKFGKEVEDLVLDAWKSEKSKDHGLNINYTSQVQQEMGKFVQQEMGKFGGDLGKFGDEKMFQEGLEAQIGIPDPLILKGIFRENVLRPDSGNKRVSPNYKIVNSDKLEYARLLGNPSEYSKDSETLLTDSERNDFHGIPIYLAEVALGKHSVGGPSAAELKDLRPEFKMLKDLYNEICGQTKNVFPGDVGYTQKSLEIKLAGKAESPYLTDLKVSIEEKLTGIAFSIGAAAGVVVNEVAATDESPKFSTVTVFWPIVSEGSRNFEAWLKQEFRKIEAGLKQFPVTYLYCDEPAKLNSDVNLAKLRERLMRLDDSQLLQICEGLGSAPSSKDERVELIVADARKTGGTPGSVIDYRQGRRRLPLRELMSVKEVRDAELRVEEAIQAYQYTGPLFEV